MAKRHTLLPNSLETLFVRLEELVLANSGEDEFEEVFKLLIAKLWDETRGEKSFGSGSTPEERHSQLDAVLTEAAAGWPGILPEWRTRLTPQHLDTCLEVLAPLEVLNTGLEPLDALFEFLMNRSAKGAKGQYFTPRYVVDFCVQMLAPRKGERVVDPASGSGAFLWHSLNWLLENGELRKEDVRSYAEQCLWGFDFDGRAVRIAKAMMLIAGDGSTNVFRVNSLLKPGTTLFGPDTSGLNGGLDEDSVFTIEDVCRTKLRSRPEFDVLLTNPPFAGEIREREILESYRLSRGKRRVERDVLFLERCVELLRPGGRMAIVLPHNKFAGREYGDLRSWTRRHLRIAAVVGLGRNTFLPHTHQKANILFAEKRARAEMPDQGERIFFAVSEEDGKDAQGRLRLAEAGTGDDNHREGIPSWSSVAHDLGDIVREFNDFRVSEGIFE